MAFSIKPKTFEEVKAYLIEKITKKYPSLGVFLTSSVLLIFVDIVAWAITLFMDFADNVFSESKLFSATVYENARRQAAFYGHIAHRKRSANGYIRVGMNSSYNSLPTESITFNENDALLINNISYLILETTTLSSNSLDDAYSSLPVGTYYVDIPVVQGTLQSPTSTAQGRQDEKVEIVDNSIENDYLVVTVNGIEYTRVPTFINSVSTDLHYTFDNLENMSGIEITFGDGFRGRKLLGGETIQVSYRQTIALEGQIKSTGFEVVFLETYTYTDTTEVTPYAINTTQLASAETIETLEEIKYYGQISASSLDEKAFTSSEVELALEDFGGILKSKALGEFDRNPDNPVYSYMNVVELLIVTENGDPLSNLQKTQIRNYLRPKMDFTDFIRFIEVDIINVEFIFDLEVYNNTPQDFSARLDSYISGLYTLGSMDFGQSINHSDVVYLVTNQFREYIRRFNLIMRVVDIVNNLTIPSTGTFIYTLLLGSLIEGRDPNIKSCTMEVSFEKGLGNPYTQSYISNEAGVFVDIGSSSDDFFSAATIDYGTGEISITVDGGVTTITDMKFKYETYDVDSVDENIDIKANQIARYYSTNNSIEVVT